jgi:hypothetical protein
VGLCFFPSGPTQLPQAQPRGDGGFDVFARGPRPLGGRDSAKLRSSAELGSVHLSRSKQHAIAPSLRMMIPARVSSLQPLDPF